MSVDRPDMVQGRSEQFQRNASLESVLKDLNESLSTLHVTGEREVQPVVTMIIGPPRSGSTLAMQWFASLGCFAYPSNLVARFFGNPAVGFQIQQVLHDFDSRNQIGLRSSTEGGSEFKSQLGRTIGALEPSEFWYWWRRFWKFPDVQKLSDQELHAADSPRFLSELAEIQHVVGRPLVMKGLHMSWHLPYLAGLSPNIVFVRIRRKSEFVAQSLLVARENFFSDRSRWWSYKPPEYEFLKNLSPEAQVAGQVEYTERAIDKGFAQIDQGRVFNIQYDQFCLNPSSYWKDFAQFMSINGCNIPDECPLDITYSARNRIQLPEHEFQIIKQACSRFRNEK